MSRHNPVAGGFFLVAPIIAGFGWGLSTGRPMQGVIVGLGIGILLALGVWLIDFSRRRRPR